MAYRFVKWIQEVLDYSMACNSENDRILMSLSFIVFISPKVSQSLLPTPQVQSPETGTSTGTVCHNYNTS